MEEIFRHAFKFFTEPAQVVMMAWIAVCHFREWEERKLSDKMRDVLAQQRETLGGMSKTIDLIMAKIVGG